MPLSALPILLLLCSPAAATAQIPLVEQRFAAVPALNRIQIDGTSIPVLAGAGLAGGAIGLVALGYAGALLVHHTSDPSGEGFEELWGFILGATIGEGLGVPLGVHLANGRRGNYGPAALASLGLAAAGTTGLLVFQDYGAVILVAVPILQVITSIKIERATAY